MLEYLVCFMNEKLGRKMVLYAVQIYKNTNVVHKKYCSKSQKYLIK